MFYYAHSQRGFSLIVAMLLMLALTILVISATRSSTLGERMSGNHMERTRAYQAAEQAVNQGIALLQSNGNTCLTGCDSSNVTGIGAVVNALPSSWSDTGATIATLASEQRSSAKFLINRLPNTSAFLPTSKTSCMPYSIMGRGVGLSADSTVVLQTVSYVCPMT